MRQDSWRRLRNGSRTILVLAVLAALLACGREDPGSPDDAAPAEEDGPALPHDPARVLPEGTYNLSLTACQLCAPGSAPDYLLAFSGGVQAVVVIGDATEWSASLRLLEMQASEGEPGDLLGLFARSATILHRDVNEAAAVFRGAIAYGPAAEFVPIFRRTGERLGCDFDILHTKHEVGPTSCTVDD